MGVDYERVAEDLDFDDLFVHRALEDDPNYSVVDAIASEKKIKAAVAALLRLHCNPPAGCVRDEHGTDHPRTVIGGVEFCMGTGVSTDYVEIPRLPPCPKCEPCGCEVEPDGKDIKLDPHCRTCPSCGRANRRVR